MVQVDGSIEIARSIEEVFDVVADERNEPKYNAELLHPEKVTDGPVDSARGSAPPTTGEESSPRWLAVRGAQPPRPCRSWPTLCLCECPLNWRSGAVLSSRRSRRESIGKWQAQHPHICRAAFAQPDLPKHEREDGGDNRGHRPPVRYTVVVGLRGPADSVPVSLRRRTVWILIEARRRRMRRITAQPKAAPSTMACLCSKT
jgi:hypothetical protein